MKITVHEAHCHEGNPVSGSLSVSTDQRLQDIAQMAGGLEYKDIIAYGKAWDALPGERRKLFRHLVREAYSDIVWHMEQGEDSEAGKLAQKLKRDLDALCG